MIVIYLLFLKKEKEKADDVIVNEKFRTGALLDVMPVPAMLIGPDGDVLGSNPKAAEILEVDELDLTAVGAAEVPGGELGRKLASGGSGSFEAETARGIRLRCTSSPVGGVQGNETHLVVLEKAALRGERTAIMKKAEQARDLVRECAETVVPVLERSSDHVAKLAGAARAASPHEAARAAQLCGVAVRLLQAARRIRLAQELVMIQHDELKSSLTRSKFDYVALAADTVQRMKSLFAAADVAIQTRLPDQALEITSDRARMGLVLRDLLEVSLAMTSPGSNVTLEVSGGDSEIEATVTDNGLGMSQEELESLFSRSGSPPVQDDYTGGIRDGLYVAKEILESAGGQLWAESAPGKGTRFNLRIPTA
jgi:signal transduction histidine kinase